MRDVNALFGRAGCWKKSGQRKYVGNDAINEKGMCGVVDGIALLALFYNSVMVLWNFRLRQCNDVELVLNSTVELISVSRRCRRIHTLWMKVWIPEYFFCIWLKSNNFVTRFYKFTKFTENVGCSMKFNPTKFLDWNIKFTMLLS